MEQPDVSMHGTTQYDWTTYTHLNLFYVSVSGRVYVDVDFKELILEELI